jgi:integrase
MSIRALSKMPANRVAFFGSLAFPKAIAKFRDWCDSAGLPQCSAHGLRKAAAAQLAELGCTEQEIMSITGHKASKEIARYTKSANQKVRAERAIDKMSVKRNGE